LAGLGRDLVLVPFLRKLETFKVSTNAVSREK